VTPQLWRAYTTAANRDLFAYAYDHNSNRTSRDLTLTTGLDETYDYDNLNRLTEFDHGTLSGGTITVGNLARNAAWDLTATGNWSGYQVDADGDASYAGAGDLNQSRSHNDVNEIYAAGDAITETGGQTAWADPAYDACGNMTTAPRPEAPASTWTCTYDAWNRLVKVEDDSQTPKTVATYEYDGLHRRVVAGIDTSSPSSPDGTLDSYRHFFYSGWQLVETRETDDAGEPAWYVRPEYQYVWSARYIDAPILRDENANGVGGCNDVSGDERLYYLTDANMNVTALADTTGAVVERYAYDPYGEVTIYDGSWANPSSTSSYDNPILFCGYYRDVETGLYHVRNRPYHPLLGAWLARDFEGYIDGMSLYAYVSCKPISWGDPLGLAADGVTVGKGAEAYLRGGYCDGVALDRRKNNPARNWRDLGERGGQLLVGAADTAIRTVKLKPVRERYGKARDDAKYGGYDDVAANMQAAQVVLCDLIGLTDGWRAADGVDPLAPDQKLTPTQRVGSGMSGILKMSAAAGAVGAGVTSAGTGNQMVSRWGDPGQGPGWVMKGGNNWRNYVGSGKWDPGPWNQFAWPSSGHSWIVPQSTLSWPQGWEFWKGVLGQRMYNP